MSHKSTPACAECSHRVKSLFYGLEGPHLEAIDRAKVVRHYRRGQPIVVEGDHAAALYCILSGVVELYKIGARDTEVVIRLLRAGDVIGYRAILANESFAASARAIKDSRICIIRSNAVLDVLSGSPQMAMRLLGKLATELRISEDELVARTSHSVVQRVSRFVSWWIQVSGDTRNNPEDISTPIRREDMAQVIGIAPETLSRALHDLERDGVLRLERRTIHVLDPHRLRRIASGERSASN